MTNTTKKLAAKDALKFILSNLKPDLGLISIDKMDRSKAHGFSVGERGKQFLLILGNELNAQQTRIITEKVFSLPQITDVSNVSDIYKGSRINQGNTGLGYKNNLSKGNQSSFIVSDLLALDQLIRWYVLGKTKPILRSTNDACS